MYKFIIRLIYKIQNKIEDTIEENHLSIDDNKFTINSLCSGGGVLRCKTCEHETNLTCYAHGHGEPNWYSKSYQCQKCGAIKTLAADDNNPLPDLICDDCEGRLSRNKKLFCPKCQSFDVEYNWQWMT